ncbi:hypothetical protein SERLA73DRAFT_186323 [Serpula lacrymans var. lacrymans S7.3]|uniref:Phosphatidylinositol N-acetylglucosaminyltransferase subunit H conserved domain-containing protein n=2 Tax=Serpula lacrymans var. lacrymans TaxID=341189 RepID=F8Q744_SERL3|nr:uncharacterized protein SERLADRAFT_397844 [Serpula lacrymans var. lacrymans S7.9]EGN95382.1 hypothetical protein SERLA73DRAFT_186323 [Serpula lacrymans var. lacrymans S7.3]EGO20918.1 hypothetical protein SERLADRAFT_397844 [Serpula lacrymans var. lacrymans S7.9]
MRRTCPLPDTHPEFSIIEWPGFWEYRVENWHLARDGSGRVINGAKTWTWFDSVLPLALSFVWLTVWDSTLALSAIALVTALLAWSRCNQVLYESVMLFPPHGVQIESHRGFPSLEPFFVSRNFIPLDTLEDFVIHEGLRRFNVRFFIAALKRSGSSNELSIHVAFENILPYFPVLLEVYQGVQRVMFRRGTDAVDRN